MKTMPNPTKGQAASNHDTLAAPEKVKLFPFTLKKILVPIDFSESSKKAATYAVAMANQFHASLAFVHVIVPIYTMDPYAILQQYGFEDQMRQIAEEKLAKLIREEIPSNICSEQLLCYGRPATEIVEAAKKVNADLIIISTRGFTGIKHAMLGSTTENVVRHASCPVLAVREKEHDFVDGEIDDREDDPEV